MATPLFNENEDLMTCYVVSEAYLIAIHSHLTRQLSCGLVNKNKQWIIKF